MDPFVLYMLAGQSVHEGLHGVQAPLSRPTYPAKIVLPPAIQYELHWHCVIDVARESPVEENWGQLVQAALPGAALYVPGLHE